MPPADRETIRDKETVAPAASHDPNDKIGPGGFGLQAFVALDRALPYRIDFENDAAATAPAQRVDITDQLDPNLIEEMPEVRVFPKG